MNKILDVNNISFRYKKNQNVLSNISFSISENEIVGILGRNGSGKTTLLNIISGFLKEYFGQVFVDNINIKNISIKERSKKISYIQQKNSVIPEYYNVEDFVIEGRRPFRNFGLYKESDYEMLDKVLQGCHLFPLKKRLINELSGGEVQRCVFARAIMKNAPLYLFDEPCSAMDIKYQKDFFSLAKNIKENLKGSLLITIHDINLAVQNCDRVLILNNGSLTYDGKTENINEKILTEAFDTEVSKTPKFSKNYYF